MITPELLRSIEPSFARIEEAYIDFEGERIGWHSTCFGNESVALGSGYSSVRDEARRIAIAETLERAFFKRIVFSPESSEFLIPEYPTSCGFAAGFHWGSTQFRSLCEAVERWALEQWIDEDCPFDEIRKGDLRLSVLAEFFAASFCDLLFYRKELSVDYDGKLVPLVCGVVVGLTESGAYIGARVSSSEDDIWTHPLIEAWRHKKIFEKVQDTPPDALSEVRRKIQFFGRNRDVALAQVANTKHGTWAIPKVRLKKEYKTGIPGIFVWRHLIDGFKGWQLGPLERFLY